MSAQELPPEDYAEIAEKIRSGEYFREARSMYDFSVHDPMAERYLYILVTAFAGLIFLITLLAMEALYPLASSVPFIYSTADIIEDIPHIKTLLSYPGQDADEALVQFMVKNYVTFREEYEIDTFDRNISGVKSQSTPEVGAAFDRLNDPHNPESPVAQYQRHSERKIQIVSVKMLKNQDFNMQVVFDASVYSKTDIKQSRWQSDIAFNYSGISLDEQTGHPKPVSFIVTKYQTKRLQDIR